MDQKKIVYRREPLKLNSKYLIPIITIYFVAILSADVVAFKFVSFGSFVISGATILFPLTYLFGDVLTEVYGYSLAKKIIWAGLIGEVVFSLLIKGVILLPSAPFANYQEAFNLTEGSMYLFVIGGVIGNIFSSFLNIYLISKWKILLSGRFFWLRSILSTAISELLIIGVAVVVGFSSRLSMHDQFSVFIWAYLLEIIYAVVFVWPAWGFSNFLKKSEGIDAYDYQVNYNPFKVQ